MARFIKLVFQLLVLITLFLSALWLFVARPFNFTTTREKVSITADAARLEDTVRKLSLTMGPRDSHHPQQLSTIADDIAHTFQTHNARVSLQTYLVNDIAFHNVISEYGFPDSEGAIIIGAHYDTYGELPGADDNASGVAALFELGRMFSQQPPPMKVLLVAYPLEEPPFFRTNDMGSYVHAASLKHSKEKVRLMISLEMLGYFSDAPNSQRYSPSALSWIFPTTGNFIAVVGPASISSATISLKRAITRSTDLAALSINAPSLLPGVDFSDHLNYWKHDFDAVMVTDTAFLRNANYHSEKDLPETLDYHRMAQVVTGVHSYVMNSN